MNKLLIRGAAVVNESKIVPLDVLIEGERISKIAPTITVSQDMEVIDAHGKHLLPGCIDDQVHFREPGLTHKATIATESKACVAGGITSYFEMPNTNPQTTNADAFANKLAVAAETSWANYGFMFGGTNDNLEQIKAIDPKTTPALKLFLGSSTGNMLVDDPNTLKEIFAAFKLPIAVHCEDEQTIKTNLAAYKLKYGDAIPIAHHPDIRSEDACYLSSSKAIALAKKTGARLHVFHLSTAKETALFSNELPLEKKQITSEVCIHHLWFSDEDYAKKGTHIKWNPAVKTAHDRDGLWEALNDDRIDIIATDHAPHTLEEKSQVYTKAPSGGPMVQHALPVLLECVQQGKITLEKVVEKMCHNPAILFDIEDRGYVREGYFADLVLVDTNKSQTVTRENVLYKCGWSPLEGTTLRGAVTHTIINGKILYNQGNFAETPNAKPLTFAR
ncbi:MAG: dihydroorotase [Bacteroidetes bacterium]|nr:dihydroorotase [Bacteroidota bacterium]MDA0888727.1 dihydroorotase [Bacteroidota bacterium]MDA1084274.1 dihydroorotase [Bacteroidota bacterium]